jgi:hypothetical protein
MLNKAELATAKPNKLNKDTKIYKQLSQCYKEVLEGTMICFDPSTGSTSSMPGYSIFKAGELQESGIISVNPNAKRNKKLFSITNSLLTEFPKPDVIIVENIPPVTFNRAGSMGGWSLVSIQRAIGAIVSCFDCEYVEMAPIVWKKYIPEGYTKNDEWDAVCIGLAAVQISKEISFSKKK